MSSSAPWPLVASALISSRQSSPSMSWCSARLFWASYERCSVARCGSHETRSTSSKRTCAAATVVKAAAKRRITGLDAADAAVVAEAVAGRADVLGSGDQHLLKLADPPVEIVSPRGLWQAFRRAT